MHSIFRHSSSATLASFFRRTAIYHGGCGVGVTIRRSFHLLSAKRDNPNNVSTNPQPSKTFLRAFFAPALAFDDKPPLEESDAIGTVAAAQANFMRVIVHEVAAGSEKSDDGDDGSSKTGVELVCVVKAVLKKIGRIVLVGDKVFVGSIDWVDRRGMIMNVIRRRTEVLDPPVANVDHLLVLFSLDQPKLEPFTLTRFLVEAESSKIPLTLALNKCDLITEEELESWKIRLRGLNYEPLFCSVETKVGLDAIGNNLRNQTSVIVGPSGVGKSSLINILRSSIAGAIEKETGFKPVLGIKWFENFGKKKKKWYEDQSVGKVSTTNGRGKHTTRNVSLLPICGGGFLADTPGFNKHKLLKVTKQLLPLCFPEIRKMIEGRKCFFEDCSHVGVTGCAVKDGWERYPYYLQLLDEIRIEEESQLKKYGTKKEGDVRYCKVGGMGEKQAVPRLDPKKYKRESRRKMKQTLMTELED